MFFFYSNNNIYKGFLFEKMMNSSHTLLRIGIAILLLMASFVIGSLYKDFSFEAHTGKILQDPKNYSLDSSWTAAFCNEKHECIDMVITCGENGLKSLTPVSQLVTFSNHWKDPRGGNPSVLCTTEVRNSLIE